MNIAVCCATLRGLKFLEKHTQLVPDAGLYVFSFPEDPWEPCYLESIKQYTIEFGGTFFSTRNLNNNELKSFWQSTTIDIMLVVSWRYLISEEIFNLPRLGTFVFHDSLLPEYRGFSPTVWAIINGEDRTGVTLFKIEGDVDSGDIIDQEPVPINVNDTISSVMEEVTQKYLSILERNISNLIRGNAILKPQDLSNASYTCKRLPEDNLINWQNTSWNIYNLIRAVSYPYPGAFTFYNGEKLMVWSARLINDGKSYIGSIPGRVVEVLPGEGSIVLTGDNALLLEKIQLEDSDIVYANEILNRITITLG